jgi:hypothetical protein
MPINSVCFLDWLFLLLVPTVGCTNVRRLNSEPTQKS